MELPPISEEEVAQEWAALKLLYPHLPDSKRYIAENMQFILKCFGESAYQSALFKLDMTERASAMFKWARIR